MTETKGKGSKEDKDNPRKSSYAQAELGKKGRKTRSSGSIGRFA